MSEHNPILLPSPKNFHLLVAGQIVTVFGSALLRFALSLYVLDITGRADIFAALIAISSVPILLSPIGGAISDRFNRKNLMVLYDAICAVVAFGFLLILLIGCESVIAVGTVMVILGIIGAMETPNGMSCIPQLVAEDKLEGANGVIQAVQSLSGIVAPVIGGIVYGTLGIHFLVLISGTAFALAAVMELFIKMPFIKRSLAGGMIRTIAGDLKDGFAYVWHSSFIRKLMVLAALLNLILVPSILIGAPLVLRKTLDSGDTLYGIGMGIIEAAMIVGALLLGVVGKRMNVSGLWRWVLVIALLFVPLGLSVTSTALSLGFVPPFVLFLLATSIMAAATTILSIFVVTRIQAKTPSENMGKVMAIIQSVAQCAAPLGQLAFGFLFAQFESAAYVPFLISGILTMGIALLGKVTLKKEDRSIHECA